MTQQQLIQDGLLIVGAASVIANILPPIEMFDPWPRFQRVYAIAIYVIYHGAALNLRGPAARAFIANRLRNPDTNGVHTTTVNSDVLVQAQAPESAQTDHRLTDTISAQEKKP